MNTSYDHFIRTTDTSHKKQVQKMFKNCMIKEIFIKVNIKVCTARLARAFFTPSQLVDGKCPDCGRECQPAKEEAYFLR